MTQTLKGIATISLWAAGPLCGGEMGTANCWEQRHILRDLDTPSSGSVIIRPRSALLTASMDRISRFPKARLGWWSIGTSMMCRRR